MEKIKLQKYFTDQGIMSRRAAEREIEAGNITVNGEVAAIGMRIDPDSDKIKLNGLDIPANKKSSEKRCFTYIMLNKPKGYVTTMNDDRGRPCVASLVADAGTRVYPVGRLDMYSDGLLLFTDDGALTAALTHPSHMIPKVYSVRLRGHLSKKDIDTLAEPMTIDGYNLRPVCVKLVDNELFEHNGLPYSTVQFILYEGRNRQIRRMCEKSGFKITSLRRTAVGSLTLGNLPQGKWRYLSEEEVKSLFAASNNVE